MTLAFPKASPFTIGFPEGIYTTISFPEGLLPFSAFPKASSPFHHLEGIQHHTHFLLPLSQLAFPKVYNTISSSSFHHWLSRRFHHWLSRSYTTSSPFHHWLSRSYTTSSPFHHWLFRSYTTSISSSPFTPFRTTWTSSTRAAARRTSA